MNATPTPTATLNPTKALDVQASLDRLNARVRGLVADVEGRFGRLSKVQRVAAVPILAALLLSVAGLTQGSQVTAYLAVFGLRMLSSAVLFIPSGRSVAMVTAAMILNPLAVAVVSGVGGALGELTGYGVGRASLKLGKSNKLAKKGRLENWVQRAAGRRMGLTILILAIAPNPFVDVLRIIAGRSQYPVGLFLTFTTVGKVIQCIAVVFLVTRHLPMVASWMQLG